MIKGLATQRTCLRHDLWVKYVDVNLFWRKSGYSPMTPQGYQMGTTGANVPGARLQAALHHFRRPMHARSSSQRATL